VASRVPLAALRMSSRSVAGSGAWVETDLPLPSGCSGLLDAKMVTNGQNNSVIHILSMTNPVSQGGALFQGQDGALVYQRSTDGGVSWSINGYIPATMDSNHYNGFDPGTYAMAVPHGDNLAFVVGDPWSDLFVMKSEDNGVTWEKTVIWQHPIPFWNGGATDTIYCPDGSVHLAFDASGKIHVVFGLTRLYSDGLQVFRFPFEGGIGYWQEGSPTWTTGDLFNCLSPDSLFQTGDLVAFHVIDWNGNGSWDVLGNFGDYNVGPISFPQLSFSDGIGSLIMSSVVENYNNGIQDYRHILYKEFYQGEYWTLEVDLNEDPVHMFDECVFPSIHNGNWPNVAYFTYQIDTEPGLSITGDDDPYGNAQINFYFIESWNLPVIINTFSIPPEGGTTSGPGSVPHSSWVTVSAHANAGWEFINWTKGNTVVALDSMYSFYAVASMDLAANFRLISDLGEIWAKDITIAPNPADESMCISIPVNKRMGLITAEILDLSGDIAIPEMILLNGVNYLDVSGLSPGVYCLLLRAGEGNRAFRKMVIR